MRWSIAGILGGARRLKGSIPYMTCLFSPAMSGDLALARAISIPDWRRAIMSAVRYATGCAMRKEVWSDGRRVEVWETS